MMCTRTDALQNENSMVGTELIKPMKQISRSHRLIKDRSRFETMRYSIEFF